MERGMREAPPQEYDQKDFMNEIKDEWKAELKQLDLELRTMDQSESEVLKAGPTAVRLARSAGNEDGAKEEIRNAAKNLIDRNLERKRIGERMDAIMDKLDALGEKYK